MNVCIFCSFITQIGFLDLFNCKCNSFKVKLNYKHREIDFVVTLGPEAEQTINFVVSSFSSRSVLKFEFLHIV